MLVIDQKYIIKQFIVYYLKNKLWKAKMKLKLIHLVMIELQTVIQSTIHYRKLQLKWHYKKYN